MQEGAEKEGLEEAPGILENTGGCVCVVFDSHLRDELAGTIRLTADASATNPQVFDLVVTRM